MKEEIQNSGEDISIVIYDAPLPPRYIKLSKAFLRSLFIVAPLILGITLLILVALILTPKIKNVPRPELPSVLPAEESKVTELENELKSLQISYKSLQEKLSSAKPSEAGGDDTHLMGILRPYGMQNLTSQNKVNLDQFEFLPTGDKTNLKFQIISTTPENRVSGHVIVFMISKGGITVYPETAAVAQSAGIKFSMGEPFAVSRLRPTNAEFPVKPMGDNVKFIVYIFSREGDLLLVKETQNYSTLGR